ncbi:uncharacterized protein LOC131648579 [Vicia villosa]|uniref:uncharacterized protein LOC131648579 n=1 Tax=Vicia villosa TaxID=3911 RepID=UPI00273B5A0F|nr:uncharacterized protein LOC131648579 [Vicia villosa]
MAARARQPPRICGKLSSSEEQKAHCKSINWHEKQTILMQFADNTILVGEGSWRNLWAIKSILRGFEMIFGLKVNMGKSNLYGIGLEKSFILAASQFLMCKIGKFPFKFLGVMVGGNHRRISFWNPILAAMKAKLSPRIGRFLSIGERITLIKSVLSNILLYYLSFFRVPILVLKELNTIQRIFLWNHKPDRQGLCWVTWSKMCKHQIDGGLGLKDLAKFNEALLAKWL